MANPVDYEALITEVYDELLKTVRADLVARNALATPLIVVLSPSGVSYSLVFDPALLFSDVKSSLHSVADARAFVVLFDGHIVTDAGPREALLMVRGTRTGVYGRAYPYVRTVFGAQFDDTQIVEPKPAELKRFEGLFP